MDLEELRRYIDRIDCEIVALLNRRMEYTLRTKKLKSSVTEVAREEEVLSGVKRQAFDLMGPEFSERLYQEIIAESKRLQSENLRLIGFQGEHGAYSEIAVRQFAPEAVPIPHTEFGEVFAGVQSGILDLGIVPVESSVAGNVTQVDDLLIQSDLHIVGELNVDIHHCLLALPETNYREIRVIYSHPQTLAQCRGFLTRTELELRPYYDSAGAAMMLARERPAASAVIASELCARLYSLEVLKENIEDYQSNHTRFLVLSRTPNEEGSGGNKCSLLFATAHEPGALFQVLRRFSEHRVNLTRIESRPLPTQPGEYAFLLDFQGEFGDPAVRDTLRQAILDTTMFRILGWYQEAKR